MRRGSGVCGEEVMCSFLLVLTAWFLVVCLLLPPRWCAVALALAVVPVTCLLSWLWLYAEDFLGGRRRRGSGTCAAPVSSDLTVSEVFGNEAGGSSS